MAEDTNADDRDDLVDKIAEEFIERLRRKENPSTSELAKEHPELAPDLEKRLKLVESIFRSAESEKTKASGLESALRSEKTQRGESTVVSLSDNFAARISCPHCGNKVQLVGIQSNLVTCGSCGSSLKIARPAVPELTEGVLPRRLGRFKVKRKLGEGAFGSVFLATDPELERDVAIKTPRHGYFATLDEERRFFREAKHAASLQHPNIVQVFEVSDNEAAPLIVSEYINGLTLNDIANKGLLTFKETASLMIQVANAVEFAHQKGVVHRDLKPGNILLDKDRNAYITDFGLAFRDDAEITMTMDGAILGTPAYMSPEQAAGNQQLTGRRSDVYSLGVILYRLMTKELPFSGTKRMLVQQVINDDPKPPRSLNDRIPRDLESITLKAMSKSPDARYQTAGAMAEDLQRFLMGEPVLAQPISSFSKFTRWCARRPAIAALSGSIAALLLLCATISTLWAMNADRLTKVANENALIATEHSRESSNRLHNFLMSNGVKELEQNNLTNSLLWFTDALALEDKPTDRIRLAMIQDRIPTLTQVVAGGGYSRNAFADFSNDGSRFVSASEKSVRVFETQSKRLLFEESVDNWKQFSFAPDGTKFIVGASSEDPSSIALWNVDQRRLTKKLTHTDLIQSVEFDSSGDKVITGSVDSFAKVWNASDGSLLAQRSFEGFWVARVAFVIGTTFVAVELNDAGGARKAVIWDYAQDVLIGKEILHESFVDHLGVSADGKKICTGEQEGKIRVWEIASGNQIGSTIDYKKNLMDIQFTENDSAVIALFANGELSTFDFQTGALKSTITRSSKFNSFAQSPDSSIVALATTDGKAAFIWRVSGVDVCTPINNGSGVTSIAFHPDGRRVALAGNEGALLIWDLAGACPSSILLEDAGSVSGALFAQNSNRCLTTSSDGKGFIWDAKTGQRLGEEIKHADGIKCSAVSSDGKLFVTGGMDKLVKVWDSLTGKQVGRSFAHDELVTAVKFSRDGSRVFSGDKNGTIRCWDLTATTVDEPRPVFELQQNSQLTSLLLSPDGSMLASASVDGRVRVWDAATGKAASPPLEHKGSEQLAMRFLPDGKRLVSGRQQSSPIMIWEIATGNVVQELSNTSRVSSIQVLENGNRILIVNLAGTATIWIADDSGQYTVEKVFRLAPNVWAHDASFDTEHSLLALCGGMLTQPPGEQRGELNLWNFIDGRPLAPTLSDRAPFYRVAFSEDGQRLLTKSGDQSARIWTLSSTTLPATDLQRIARLHAQYIPNAKSELVRMDATTQQKELDELSAKYPSYFTLTEADRTIWEYELKQNSSSDQPQN